MLSVLKWDNGFSGGVRTERWFWTLGGAHSSGHFAELGHCAPIGGVQRCSTVHMHLPNIRPNRPVQTTRKSAQSSPLRSPAHSAPAQHWGCAYSGPLPHPTRPPLWVVGTFLPPPRPEHYRPPLPSKGVFGTSLAVPCMPACASFVFIAPPPGRSCTRRFPFATFSPAQLFHKVGTP